MYVVMFPTTHLFWRFNQPTTLAKQYVKLAMNFTKCHLLSRQCNVRQCENFK